MNAQSVNSLSGQKKFTCRIGASEWFSNRLGCNDSPNGEPENPGNDDWLSTMYACCQDGMAGTSPMGRSDGTSGQKPATENKPRLSTELKMTSKTGAKLCNT
jgi:hypothetical protein